MIAATDLTKKFGEKRALDAISCSIPSGSVFGLIGSNGAGKSTLFNALTDAGAESANYPFCTIEPNVGIVPVPDKRLDKLAEMYNPEKYTPAVIEFVDIAGLVRGASHGEGLGNKFLSHIREVDAILHIVRCFDDGNIIHVDGSVDPVRDVDTINMELILADLELVEKRLPALQKLLRNGDKSLAVAVSAFAKVNAALSAGKSARTADLSEDELAAFRDTPLLTLKPVIYVANVSEDEAAGDVSGNRYYQKLAALAASEHTEVLPICAQIEAEIAQLDGDDKAAFLEDMGIAESGLDRLIQASYALLGLISYLTAGPKEVRAWTIRKGTKAPQAAGKIHSDFERGFIRAEVIGFDELMRVGSMTAAKEAGLVRSEGKEYVMQDGDIVLFRFNV